MYSSRTQGALRELAAITRQYQSVAEGDRKTASSPIRHKVFISYHAVDAVEVLEFIEGNTDVFIPRAIGMEEDGSDIIDSTNVAYIRQTIKSKFLRDSTVPLVAIGECTWARKFVDWEIYTSLRSDPTPNGLLAVQLPSVAGSSPSIPARLSANLAPNGETGYANYYVPPTSQSSLRSWIQEAFDGRTSRASLLKVGGKLRERNSPCEPQ
ncbi:TIR domain-containing protein [Microbacterium tenebrionis]|uniref:TIR domain-containing protein n=1 Tax=Microbacterium tenebrionis TaxID=2830665 RepID=UPI00158AD43B